ncbi:hypothetical protein AGMMS50267_12880 [Spirochaetia bacterium]|nr:hypothetical protein AGMMS50267_12880 [Spirochaetia bacterium]
MVSSLKKYKGIDMFVSLARRIPDYSFFLVISSSNNDIEKYFLHAQLPNNIKLIPEQINLIPYYFNASVVVNLSIPDLWIETFGMTLIEGFELGTPCVAPDSGGPKEIVESGKNGILVNTVDENAIIEAIGHILGSRERYVEFVKNVFALRKRFSVESSIKCLIQAISDV